MVLSSSISAFPDDVPWGLAPGFLQLASPSIGCFFRFEMAF